MACVVNGPGESKPANIGISLPGTFEEPKAPVYVDGALRTTLKGDRIVPEFLEILETYRRRALRELTRGGVQPGWDSSSRTTCSNSAMIGASKPNDAKRSCTRRCQRTVASRPPLSRFQTDAGSTVRRTSVTRDVVHHVVQDPGDHRGCVLAALTDPGGAARLRPSMARILRHHHVHHVHGPRGRGGVGTR